MYYIYIPFRTGQYRRSASIWEDSTRLARGSFWVDLMTSTALYRDWRSNWFQRQSEWMGRRDSNLCFSLTPCLPPFLSSLPPDCSSQWSHIYQTENRWNYRVVLTRSSLSTGERYNNSYCSHFYSPPTSQCKPHTVLKCWCFYFPQAKPPSISRQPSSYHVVK